jgi:hypothetical protein
MWNVLIIVVLAVAFYGGWTGLFAQLALLEPVTPHAQLLERILHGPMGAVTSVVAAAKVLLVLRLITD